MIAAATLGRMEKKVTLEILAGSVEQVAERVDTLTLIVQRGFEHAKERFIAIDGRLETIDGRFEANDRSFDVLGRAIGSLETRVGSLETKFDGLETKVDNGFRMLKDRIERTELAVYQVQKEIGVFDQEMRTVHKVLDNLDGRLLRVEGHIGLAQEN